MFRTCFPYAITEHVSATVHVMRRYFGHLSKMEPEETGFFTMQAGFV
jgi:hypothetical protein